MDALVNFSEFVEFPFKCCKLFGLIPYKTDEIETRKKKLLKIYHFTVIANFIFSWFIMGMFMIENIRDLAKITEAVPTAGYSGLAVVKSIMIYLRKDQLKDLMETLSLLFPKKKDEQKIFKVRKYYGNYKKMEKWFSVIVSSVGIIFIIVPIARFLMTGVWIGELPFKLWYPFDKHNPYFYNLAFLWELIIAIVTVLALLGPDLILYAFITLITMQFENLNQQIKNLKNCSKSEAFDKVVELVELHETLIRMSRNLEEIYSVSILFNFFGSSILICLVSYQLSIGISVDILMKFMIFFAASLVQIMMPCYYGNKLTTASEAVAIAAYESGWEEMDEKKFKAAVVMIIQRSQRPCFISAHKFAVVSLEAFTSVRF